MVIKALSIAERLAKDGIEVEVIDPRTLLPLDTETIIQSVMRTGRLLVVHEACQTGGWAGEVIACVVGSPAFDYLDTPVRRLGGKDIPIPYNRFLEKYAIPQDDEIEQEIRAMVEGKI
jgi:acetoin:2,6-dichlorophenolindophenol oxidoreductase subunit beta